MDYLKRFETLVNELRNHEYIEIVEFTPQPPATASALKAVEKKLKAKLEPEIRRFYEEANGLKLHWQIRPNVSPEVAKQLRKKSTDYYVKIAEYIEDPFAIINLIPLDDSIVARKWKELKLGATEKTATSGGAKYKFDEFIERLKPFDVMNREMCMAFFIEEANGDPSVLLLTEGYTDWADSRLTDFSSYLEMLFATRGIVEARRKIFYEPDGNKKPPLIGDKKFWEKYVPKLFRNEK